jgi:Transcriptional Coactivator p15 (PC4)
MDSTEIYQKILHTDDDKGKQLRLVLNTFREVEYLHIRKYYLSFDEGYLPSKEGISMPGSISSVYALLDGLIEICSRAEGIDSLHKHLLDKLEELKDAGTPQLPELS